MGFKDQLTNVLQEIDIMKKLVHPNLVSLLEIIDSGDKLYMGNLNYYHFQFQ